MERRETFVHVLCAAKASGIMAHRNNRLYRAVEEKEQAMEVSLTIKCNDYADFVKKLGVAHAEFLKTLGNRPDKSMRKKASVKK